MHIIELMSRSIFFSKQHGTLTPSEAQEGYSERQSAKDQQSFQTCGNAFHQIYKVTQL